MQDLEPETFLAVLQALATGTFLIAFLECVVWLVGCVGILFAETFAVRSWIFHAANGTASAFAGAWIFPALSGETSPLADPFYLLASGLAGGLVYWLVAGWNAGFWKPVLARPAGSSLPPPPHPPVPAA